MSLVYLIVLGIAISYMFAGFGPSFSASILKMPTLGGDSHLGARRAEGVDLSGSQASARYEDVMSEKRGYLKELQLHLHCDFTWATAAPTLATDGPEQYFGLEINIYTRAALGNKKLQKVNCNTIKGLRTHLKYHGVRWNTTFANGSSPATLDLEWRIPLGLLGAPVNRDRESLVGLGWIYSGFIDRIEVKVTRLGSLTSGVLWATNGANVSDLASTLHVSTIQASKLPPTLERSVRGIIAGSGDSGAQLIADMDSGNEGEANRAMAAAHALASVFTAYEEYEAISDIDASDEESFKLREGRVYRNLAVLVDDATDGFEFGNVNEYADPAFELRDVASSWIIQEISERDVLRRMRSRFDAQEAGGTGQTLEGGVYYFPFDPDDNLGGSLSTQNARDVEVTVFSDASLTANSRVIAFTEHFDKVALDTTV